MPRYNRPSNKKIKELEKAIQTNKINMHQLINNEKQTRPPYKAYRMMSSRKLVSSLLSVYNNYDLLRNKYIEKCLEKGHLLRRILVLERKILKMKRNRGNDEKK